MFLFLSQGHDLGSAAGRGGVSLSVIDMRLTVWEVHYYQHETPEYSSKLKSMLESGAGL
jgi:hypothetical protein